MGRPFEGAFFIETDLEEEDSVSIPELAWL